MDNKLFIAKLTKRNGKLEFKSGTDQALFVHLASKLREGQSVEQIINFEPDDGTLTQISKIHKMIELFADEIGENKIKLKIDLKKEFDFYNLNGELRSFGEASRQELSAIIQFIIEKGNFVGINLDNWR